MNTEQEVARFIVDRVHNAQSILGAKLGAIATAQFPGISFKNQYGGLRAFVQRYCGDAVKISQVPVGEFGKDDLYASPEAAPSTEGAPPSHSAEHAETPWRAFTLPESSSSLWINPETEEIRVSTAPSETHESPWIVVPKLTMDDHRSVAIDFLPEIAESERERFKQLTHAADFWRQWFNETRYFANGKYSKPWSLFRFNKLCQLFVRRLTQLGLSVEKADALLEKLKQLKSAERRPSAKEPRTVQLSSGSGSALRAIARTAIESMSDDELRRIWLPLGVVVDAGRRANP